MPASSTTSYLHDSLSTRHRARSFTLQIPFFHLNFQIPFADNLGKPMTKLVGNAMSTPNRPRHRIHTRQRLQIHLIGRPLLCWATHMTPGYIMHTAFITNCKSTINTPRDALYCLQALLTSPPKIISLSYWYITLWALIANRSILRHAVFAYIILTKCARLQFLRVELPRSATCTIIPLTLMVRRLVCVIAQCFP